MTLWAVLSDVHGNLPALERAVALCRARGAERFVFLGDLLGRGDPEGVVALARALADVSVVGNRDLDWADRVSPESRAYVLGLPRRAETDTFVAVHGDPRLDRQLSMADIRRSGPRSFAWLRQHGRRLLFFGHTHHARVWRKASADAPPALLDGGRQPLRFEGEAVYLVNVGTVGRPFPGKGPPSYALYQDDAAAPWVELCPLHAAEWR